MAKNKKSGRRLIAGTSVAVMSLAMADSAYAQDTVAPPTPDCGDKGCAKAADGIEEIVITGFRESLNKALETKREATGVVDSIVAEDIGKFPDNNLAEAMQRVPGVTIARDRGEGKQISVRGLSGDYTRVRINGMEGQAATKGNDGVNRSRAFDFNVFASELFSNLQVRKTASADVEEGSLGATVDLSTPHPFDFDGFKMSAGVKEAYNDEAEAWDPRMSFLVANTFADGKFGALFSVAYSGRTTDLQQSNSGQWDTMASNGGFCDPESSTSICAGESLPTGLNHDQLTSATIFHPRFPRYLVQHNDEDRVGLTGSLQWNAGDRTLLTFDALYSNVDTTYHENEMEAIGFSRSASQAGKPQMIMREGVVEGNNLVYGVFDNVDIRSENYLDKYSAEFQQYTLNFSHEFTDRLKMSALAGHSEANLDNPTSTIVQMDRLDSDGYSYDLRENSKMPAIDYGFDVTDPDAWYIGPVQTSVVSYNADGSSNTGKTGPEIRLRPASVDNSFDTGQLDFSFDATNAITLKTGALYKKFKMDSKQYRMASEAVVPEVPSGYTNADLTELYSGYGYINTHGTPKTYRIPSIKGYEKAFGINCNCGDFTLLDATQSSSAAGSTYSVTEEDTGGYLQMAVHTDVVGIPVRGDFGGRYVQTDQTSVGYSATSGGLTAVEINRTYDDFLPSMNLSADVLDDVVLRLSSAKVMTRPGLGSLNPGGSVTVSGGSRTISSGNPNLKPIKATNLDLSAEWYFAPESVLSAGWFYKNIDTFITSFKQSMPYSETGLPLSLIDGTGASEDDDFTVSAPVNSKGGTISGLEVAYQQPLGALFSALDGWGVIINYTYVDAQLKYLATQTANDDGSYTSTYIKKPLTGMSKNSYNATLYYEHDRLSARVAAAYRSDFLTAVPSGRGPSVGTEGAQLVTGQRGSLNIDASAQYDLTDQLTLSLEGLNLTNEHQDLYIDESKRWETSLYYGRQYMVGMRYNF